MVMMKLLVCKKPMLDSSMKTIEVNLGWEGWKGNVREKKMVGHVTRSFTSYDPTLKAYIPHAHKSSHSKISSDASIEFFSKVYCLYTIYLYEK